MRLSPSVPAPWFNFNQLLQQVSPSAMNIIGNREFLNNVGHAEHAAQYIKDQLTSAPLALDRLRCGIELLCSLLRYLLSEPSH